jgi:hypothetical protein
MKWRRRLARTLPVVVLLSKFLGASQQVQFFNKLLSDRDRVFSERLKVRSLSIPGGHHFLKSDLFRASKRFEAPLFLYESDRDTLVWWGLRGSRDPSPEAGPDLRLYPLCLYWILNAKGRARDDRHVDRAAKQYDQQRNDMHNSKKYVGAIGQRHALTNHSAFI